MAERETRYGLREERAAGEGEEGDAGGERNEQLVRERNVCGPATGERNE